MAEGSADGTSNYSLTHTKPKVSKMIGRETVINQLHLRPNALLTTSVESNVPKTSPTALGGSECIELHASGTCTRE